jgi:hypothetical protein
MPFKANAARRHRIPKQRHRVMNWAEYDAALRQRGSLTVWFSEEAITAWQAEPRTTRGGQPHYSALAIRTALTLRAVFRLALRQTEGLIDSILKLLGLDLAVPDHSTLSRRAETLEMARPIARTGPVHLLVDSTGLQLCGAGEWLVEKHGTRRRRSWRKLHIGVDAETGQILASELTTSDGEDGSQVEPLLDQITGPRASFIGDGPMIRPTSMTLSLSIILMPTSSSRRDQRRCRVIRRRALRPSATGISKASRSMDASAGRSSPGTLVGLW